MNAILGSFSGQAAGLEHSDELANDVNLRWVSVVLRRVDDHAVD